MENIASLEKKLKVKFKNKEVLQQALVHRSYINENPGFHLGHNERLEFLGDAVLELVVTEFLYTTYPNPEGELTNWRASLVNSKILSSITRNMDIEEFLYLSRGESKDRDSKARSYILANAFEAIVGAIYMDRGYKEAKIFIERHVLTELPNILKNHLYLDPKSKFQEISQEKFGITPTYSVISESGPDHNKKFKVGLYLEDELVATSDGSSKREAQERAAAEGLKAKGWE
ncbi:MAG: Ribonuclease 3 [Parcubacteria group bacterium GW2011_GWA2_38_13]|nr:MAG: Ribonuclease 3 [Parcubacteria group bacterium GW2011_GWA2_38_13]